MSRTPASVLRHPGQVTDAVRRRRFERGMRRAPLRPQRRMIHLGTAYGGWWIPDGVVRPHWCCYSVGTGADVSFDLELLRRYGCRVRAFDPYPLFGEMALTAAGHHPRYTFHPCAVAARDGPVRMYGRQDEEAGSVSAVDLYRADEVFVRPGRSLPSLMRELGDRTVELLKLDVEGSEYGIVPGLDLPAMGVEVFCVEVHHNAPSRRARALLAGVCRQGYAVAARKDPTSFTLVRA